MLDILRRRASSWIVKVILAMIILTFVIFFGYSNFYSKYFASQQARIALVGDEPIPRQKFEVYYQNSVQQFQKQLDEAPKDEKENSGPKEIPDALRNLLKKNILDQLIAQELMAQYAQALGLRVSDQALAKAITTNPHFKDQGNFDLTAYHERYLPYYEHRFGENFEDSLRKELLIERLNVTAQDLFGPWQAELKTTSLAPSSLLGLWTDNFREKVKIDVNPSAL